MSEASVSDDYDECRSYECESYAERSVSNFRSRGRAHVTGKSEVKTQENDSMTELINLQKSNGGFVVSAEDWTGSVLEKYLGNYTDVKSKCPSGIGMNLWITGLSMKIFEIKMGEKKELWDLVARKSQKFLNLELNKEKEKYQRLIEEAEKYVKSK